MAAGRVCDHPIFHGQQQQPAPAQKEEERRIKYCNNK